MPMDTQTLTPDFLADAELMLNEFDQNLTALEMAPQDTELLTGTQRIAHTLNGTAGFLGFSGVCEVAKAGEMLLSKLVDGTASLSRERLRCLREASEVLRGWMKRIAAGSPTQCTRHEGILSELVRLAQSDN
jgi:two-component system chemotaxis sensor kinase CheA